MSGRRGADTRARTGGGGDGGFTPFPAVAPPPPTPDLVGDGLIARELPTTRAELVNIIRLEIARYDQLRHQSELEALRKTAPTAGRKQ